MPKMTPKYAGALKAREQYGIVCDTTPQDALYGALQQSWIFWDSKAKVWEKAADPDPPSPLLDVRVMGDMEQLKQHMLNVRSALEMRGYRCVDESDMYMNRPPKQLEGRIYLKFLPGGNVA